MGLPLSAFAASEALLLVDIRFDKTNDGVVDGSDWRQLKASEKQTYARMSLEAIAENPDGLVMKGKTREDLLLQGLEAIYGK